MLSKLHVARRHVLVCLVVCGLLGAFGLSAAVTNTPSAGAAATKAKVKARAAAVTDTYLTRGRHPIRDYFGPRHTLYENWMQVFDCGGITNENCNHHVWEFNQNGWRPWDEYGAGKGWFGKTHARTQVFTPACRTDSFSSQLPDRKCYSGWGT